MVNLLRTFQLFVGLRGTFRTMGVESQSASTYCPSCPEGATDLVPTDGETCRFRSFSRSYFADLSRIRLRMEYRLTDYPVGLLNSAP